MNIQTQHKRAHEEGFTLVELAVVMIIIGLLIGGVLKGQELITNAQVTSTIAQIRGIDAAITTFDDVYDALPGDIQRAAARLPNCLNAPCSAAGDGNGTLNALPSAAPAGETLTFFVHLAAADLLSGIDPAGGLVFGGQFPESEVGGNGFHVGETDGTAALAATTGGPNPRSGIYLALTATPAVATAAGTTGLLPNQAFRIDNKLDDGVPDSGSVRAFGDGTCANGGLYLEAQQGENCGLYVRVQG